MLEFFIGIGNSILIGIIIGYIIGYARGMNTVLDFLDSLDKKGIK